MEKDMNEIKLYTVAKIDGDRWEVVEIAPGAPFYADRREADRLAVRLRVAREVAAAEAIGQTTDITAA